MSMLPRRLPTARIVSISWVLCLFLHSSTRAQADEEGRVLTLAELLAHAETHAPRARVAAERQGYADAARAGADPRLRYNPTIEFGIGPRFDGSGDRDYDFIASLAQPVEIAGERGLRRAAASRLGEQLEAQSAATRWEIRRDVILAYRAAVVAREQVSIGARLVGFAEGVLAIARRRLGAGDVSAIDVRVAETDVAQARQAEVRATQALRTARIRLAEVSGWSIEAPPDVPPGLPAAEDVPPLSAVLALALDAHPELRARHAAVDEAHARVALADRDVWPAPSFGVQVAREGSAGSPANYIVLGTLGLTLPTWQRNREERARSRVDEEVATVEEEAAVRELRSRVARMHAELVGASERLALFDAGLGSLEEGLTLLRRGFEAGEIPLLEVAVARERFVRYQSDAILAYADRAQALAELEYAVGAELGAASSAGGAR